MRKLALLMVGLLLVTIIAPYNVLASSNNQEKKDEQLNYSELEQTEEQLDDSANNIVESETKNQEEIKATINEEKDNSSETSNISETREPTNNKKNQGLESEDSNSNVAEDRVNKDEQQQILEDKEKESSAELSENENNVTRESSSIRAATVKTIKEEYTSKLGHIRSKDVKIYKDLTDLSVYENAGTKYTHQVYFI
ncbi:hypothetical protein GLW20_12845, partial [Virgibacillus halodenitrificans]|nr:hypothetical protein [Virgibacillus halodenitrificans]